MHRERSHPHDFSPFFPVRGSGSPPQLQSLTTLHPHVALILDQVQKRVKVKSTRRPNQVLKVTDYHISRYVASTFKSLIKLPHTATLLSFHYTDGASQVPQPRPSSLYFAVCSRQSIHIISRAAGNHSTFTGPN
jgi:hypothetical protein